MKKYRSKQFYTLIELLMAMAIFAIISVIMMRFFNSAQQIWSKASQKNVLYSDARVALDIMSAEIQSALYDNKLGIIADPNKIPGIYPFWFEYKDIDDTATSFAAPSYTYNAADKIQQALYNKKYVTQLNFISDTPFKTHTNASNICEVKYLYLPVRSSNNPDYPTGVWSVRDDTLGGTYPIKGGALLRGCTANLKSSGATNFDSANINCFYNFLLLPHDSSLINRVKDIFKRESSEKFVPVIDGIVDMKITCYTLQFDSINNIYSMKSYNPMKDDGTIAVAPADLSANEDLFNAADIGTMVSGTPFPVAVKIDIYMLAERDLREWLTALNSNLTDDAKVAAANKIKIERMRCFSKTIYLSGGK